MPTYSYKTPFKNQVAYVIQDGDKPILTLSSGVTLEFSPNFEFLTDKGWKDAKEIVVGEPIWSFQEKNLLNRQKQRIIDAVLASGDFVMIERIAKMLNIKVGG